MAYLNDNPKIPIAARDLVALRKHVGRPEPLAGTSDANAFVVDPGDHRRQLWVRPLYTDYRMAWELLHHHIPDKMDVDHIYNRARAHAAGATYVRLFLCARGVNRSHGAFIEKRLTEAVLERPLLWQREIAYASNWTIAKMAGFAINRANPSYDQAQALNWLYFNNFI